MKIEDTQEVLEARQNFRKARQDMNAAAKRVSDARIEMGRALLRAAGYEHGERIEVEVGLYSPRVESRWVPAAALSMDARGEMTVARIGVNGMRYQKSQTFKFPHYRKEKK
jgi:hypothetical protein